MSDTRVKGKRVLVTGGAGLVGSHIVDELVRRGADRIVVYDNLVRGLERNLDWARTHGNVELVVADIADRDAIGEAMRGAHLCFHQAAMWLRECQKEPRRAIETNVLGSFNVLEACVANGVRKVVAASSSSVYGEGLYLPTDEDHPFQNDLFYGMTKVSLEQLLRCFSKEFGLDYVGLRYLNVYGPRQPFQAAYTDVIMHFMNRIDAGEPAVIHGDGNQTVDLVYAGDIAKLNLLAMESDVTGEFINGCTGNETSLTELAEAITALRGRSADLPPRYEPRDDRLVQRRCGCPKKAREMLGFVAETPLSDGLAAVAAWRDEVKADRA
ncbi:MAG: NAD-dependent epimerase/dehydratase family protein [Deltaproteobacteria bacterium]|nr:MAG: NAD-dependent epimerase/dehydratase family protein [Deltaproteobacteria bacterium]